MKEKFNFQNAGKWLDDNWNLALVLNIIGTGCLAIAGAFGNNLDDTIKIWVDKNYFNIFVFNPGSCNSLERTREQEKITNFC